jgi:hypothetical protein
MGYIAGVGPGLFAVIFAACVALVITFIGAYVTPRNIVFVALASTLIPLVVFACILSAPRKSQPLDSDTVVDHLLPLRISLILWLGLGLIGCFLYKLVALTLKAPPYKRPDVTSRRRVLEKSHPTWHL